MQAKSAAWQPHACRDLRGGALPTPISFTSCEKTADAFANKGRQLLSKGFRVMPHQGSHEHWEQNEIHKDLPVVAMIDHSIVALCRNPPIILESHTIRKILKTPSPGLSVHFSTGLRLRTEHCYASGDDLRDLFRARPPPPCRPLATGGVVSVTADAVVGTGGKHAEACRKANGDGRGLTPWARG